MQVQPDVTGKQRQTRQTGRDFMDTGLESEGIDWYRSRVLGGYRVQVSHGKGRFTIP